MIKMYSVIFTDPRYGDQDSMRDFYTPKEAREFGEKESRKYGIRKFKVIEIEKHV